MSIKNISLITKKVEFALLEKGFKKSPVQKDEKFKAIFSNDNIYYGILFDKDTKKIELVSGGVSENKIEDDYSIISSWLFNIENSDEKEANSIANDFISVISGPVAKKITKKRRKKSDDNDNDPMFLMNRFASFFPSLKDDIKQEKQNHDSFRFVTFTKEKVLSHIQNLLSQNIYESDIKKISKLLSDNYENGDLDTRSLITIVILNSIENERSISLLESNISKELNKAWHAAKKLKGKKIKPERVKKTSKFVADTLNSK